VPKIQYEPNTMRPAQLAVAEQAATIAREYSTAGYSLTLRQLYYQFVARGLTADWPTGHNTERSYKRLGSIVDKARMCGLIDWFHIEDRTRGEHISPHWETPGDIINSARASYSVDKWQEQPERVAVWVEKEALAGVIGGVAEGLDTPYMACRGYMSSSALWRAARRLGWIVSDGTRVTVLHLGDHDPSGIDMSRDNEDRLRTIIAEDHGILAERRLSFERIALNRDQIDEYNPPPNPAKMSDSRAQSYAEEHGYESWELDALPPDALAELVRGKIEEHLDRDLYEEWVAREAGERQQLRRVSDNWAEIASYADERFGEG